MGNHKAIGEQREKEFRDQPDAQVARDCDSGYDAAVPRPLREHFCFTEIVLPGQQVSSKIPSTELALEMCTRYTLVWFFVCLLVLCDLCIWFPFEIRGQF